MLIAFDFYLLRAQNGEADADAASWWADFAAATDQATREDLIAQLTPARADGAPKKRRRKRAASPSVSGESAVMMDGDMPAPPSNPNS